jgi:predicted glutamine amidotransferase
MCELFAMSSRVPASVNMTLEELSRHGGLTGPHRDGWGIAYYDEGEVRLIKEAAPAASSDVVQFIERHNLRSTIVVSHIRHATQGRVCLRNTQPFTRELGGRMHLFAHNGDFGDIISNPRFELGDFRPIGDTDSEYAFCVLMGRMKKLWLDPDQPWRKLTAADRAASSGATGATGATGIAGAAGDPGGDVPPFAERFAIVREFLGEMRRKGPANIIYADGATVFAHGDRRLHQETGEVGPPGLYVTRHVHPALVAALDIPGLRIMIEEEAQDVLLFASVPLTEDDWVPLLEGEIVAAADGILVASAQS